VAEAGIDNKSGGVLSNVRRAAAVFAEHGGYVRAVIARNARNRSQIDDLCQNFFLTLVAKPVPEGVRNVRTYLYRAIIRDILDSARSLENYRNRNQRHHEQREVCKHEVPPEQVMIIAEERLKMLRILEAHLTGAEATAMELRFMEDYTITEAARSMGVDNRTVSRYLSTAMAKLRRLFGLSGGKL